MVQQGDVCDENHVDTGNSIYQHFFSLLGLNTMKTHFTGVSSTYFLGSDLNVPQVVREVLESYKQLLFVRIFDSRHCSFDTLRPQFPKPFLFLLFGNDY